MTPPSGNLAESREGAVRDRLAVQRTHLANERTLLAYARTALMLISSGAAVLKVLAESAASRAGGWSLIALGAAVALCGVGRFLTVRRQL